MIESAIKYLGITGVEQFGNPGGAQGSLARLYG
jgi:hypothetical protein